MQTVPTLVGTGTAVAAAASGLVFGQPLESTPTPSRRPSLDDNITPPNTSRPATRRYDTLPASRPPTASVTPPTGDRPSRPHVLLSRPPLSRHHRPASAQLPLQTSQAPQTPHTASRRSSFAPSREPSNLPVAEVPRDSVSSRNSWINRLSMRPLSHHGSLQSSLDFDNTSIAFSHGSSAPILSPRYAGAALLPPNKLVKRSSTNRHDELEDITRRRSNRPTLRRPATSHQRSATLHQIVQSPEFTSSRNCSFEQPQQTDRYSYADLETPEPAPTKRRRNSWALFFRSETTDSPIATTVSRASPFTPNTRVSNLNKIRPSDGNKGKAHLVKPSRVSHSWHSEADHIRPAYESAAQVTPKPVGKGAQDQSGKSTPARSVKRTFSMSFSSAGNLFSRTSGSIRRPKRGAAENKEGTKRYVSAPLLNTEKSIEDVAMAEDMLTPSAAHSNAWALPPTAIKSQKLPRQRNSSSPLPPLSALSPPPVDGSRSSSSGKISPHRFMRSNQPSGSSSSSAAMSSRRVPTFDRGSTLDGSDFLDDDDTDFKSDTLFDSIRTAGSSRCRAIESPLDSLYDESPPSTAGNGKAKRLSIQEMLGKDWTEGNRIMEEDENAATPVRHDRSRVGIPYRDGPSLSPKEEIRPSIDDDFDEDWDRDDDVHLNSLSPPSKGSLNSRGINPNVRLALANISGNGALDNTINDTISERPLSNIFDWAEPSIPERPEAEGQTPRPKTSYAKQQLDPRGGRSVTRKGPTPTHVRSQSVPVVHDQSDDARSTNSKYGTWGMSSKTVSEDWDEDFEFGGGSTSGEGTSQEDIFAVPEPIRATQTSVRAHSGQIREFSLLVNDLKRLCRHGRDMGLLDGPYKSLWKEAEGIITLASPDEESEGDDAASDFSVDMDAFDVEESHTEDGLDAKSLQELDAAIDSHPAMSKIAVVRERPSPRRRSVFSPDDDIFGVGASPAGNEAQVSRSSRPRTPEVGARKQSSDVNGVVRHVMEAMQQRSITPKPKGSGKKNERVHFDTNSLRALVKRASDLRDILSDAIRKVDQIMSSPARTPRTRVDRDPQSSPAFVKVFDEPTATPPRRGVPTRVNSSGLETSPEASPSSGINRRMQMMTVN